MSHTPGPWSYTNERVVGPAGNTIADCRYKNGLLDARLIAAAPEMLEALKSAYTVLTDDVPGKQFDDTVEAVYAAIAKATGGAQ